MVITNIVNKQLWTAENGLGVGLTTIYRKMSCYWTFTEASEYDDDDDDDDDDVTYASPNIISVIKSWSVRYVRNIVSMREMRNLYKILVAKLEG